MSAAPHPNATRALTAAEYLEIELAAEHKSEFLDGVMYAMAGAKRAHNAIKDNLIGELHARLKGGPCRTYSSDQRVKVGPGNLFVYPDIVVMCGPPEVAEENEDTFVNPQAIVEVLSPSTSTIDRTKKFKRYLKLPALREIVFVQQDAPEIQVFSRTFDGAWRIAVHDDLAEDLELPSLGVRIPLVDVCRGVAFPPSPVPEPPR